MRIAQISEDLVAPDGYEEADDDDLESFGDPSEWKRQWFVIIIDTEAPGERSGERTVVYPNQEHPDPDVAEILDGPYTSLADAVAAVEEQNLDRIEVQCGFPAIRRFWLTAQEEFRLTVDGQEWTVTHDETQPGAYEYRWLTAPVRAGEDPDRYGFGSRRSDYVDRNTREDHESAIRDFMSGVAAGHFDDE